MPDVTIPADVAKQFAAALRSENTSGMGLTAHDRDHLADLLDPKPPSLREQVAKAWCAEVYGEFSGSAQNPAPDHLDAADAVLAVVADWLAAQPLSGWCMTGYLAIGDQQRDHDVRLLRGVSDV